MGSLMSRDDESDDEDTMEVYLLYKKLGAEKYIRDHVYSHHTVLFKHSNGTFYYTDLDVDSKGGPCQLHFGKYTFLDMPIFYMPRGCTRKRVNEIIEWTKQNQMAGTPYRAVLNDCQRYASECIRFLNIIKIPRPPTMARLLGGLGSPNSLVQEYLKILSADSPNALSLS